MSENMIPDEDFQASKEYARHVAKTYFGDEPSWFRSKLVVSLSKAYVEGYLRNDGQ